MKALLHLALAASLFAAPVHAADVPKSPPPPATSADGLTVDDLQNLDTAVTLAASSCATNKAGCVVGYNADALHAKLKAIFDRMQQPKK